MIKTTVNCINLNFNHFNINFDINIVTNFNISGPVDLKIVLVGERVVPVEAQTRTNEAKMTAL